MYKTVNIVKKLCNRDGITIKKLEQQIGLSNGSVMKWDNSSPKIKNLEKVSSYFKVPLECLIGKPCAIQCDICGYEYVANCSSSEISHEKRHQKCLEAISKFGFWWSYEEREKLKAQARNRIYNEHLSIPGKVNAYEIVFKSHFSRSVESNRFNLSHPYLNEFIAMLLYQKQFRNKIDEETYNALVSKYGVRPGIEEGTTYYICNNTDKSFVYRQKNNYLISTINLDNMFIRMEKLSISKNVLSDELGISIDTVNNWEKGRSMPNAIKLSAIADCLDCSVDYLLGRTGNPDLPKTEDTIHTPQYNDTEFEAAHKTAEDFETEHKNKDMEF